MRTPTTSPVSRRTFVRGTAAFTAIGAAASLAMRARPSRADETVIQSLVASPPDGFEPMTAPGKVVKVTKGTDFPSLMQPNQLWPKPEVAKQMLERAMMELTGAANLTESLKKFISPRDVVGLKVNGIAGQKGYTMAYNFEMVLPLVESLLELGVPADKISIYEQFPSFLFGTRVGVKGNDLPKGVKIGYHANRDAKMPDIAVYYGIKTKYVSYATEATAIIDCTQMKDHSICGFTGAMKNMTHGQIINPEKHHAHHCNPQIAMLYNNPILQSRVRLHVTDAFKIIYDGGPLDKNPKRRIPHGAVYVSTDPVALDRVGWKVIDKAREAHKLPSLAEVGREPAYIQTAGELGVGVFDDNAIRLREVAI